MDDEAFFLNLIQSDRSDCGARLLFGEFLMERGDKRAVAYRWASEHKKFPFFMNRRYCWLTSVCYGPASHGYIEQAISDNFRGGDYVTAGCRAYMNEPDAMADLAIALAKREGPFEAP